MWAAHYLVILIFDYSENMFLISKISEIMFRDFVIISVCVFSDFDEILFIFFRKTNLSIS